MRYLPALAVATLLSGCGTMAFTPAEYPLRSDAIPAFDAHGAVAISNAQPSSDQVIVYSYMGSKLGSDLKSITDVMVKQAQEELQKHGSAGAGGTKSIALKVNSLVSEYQNAFFWHSNMDFQATLGDGQVLSFTVPHSSGILAQDLNGCIAQGVIALFKDPRVKAYLAS